MSAEHLAIVTTWPDFHDQSCYQTLGLGQANQAWGSRDQQSYRITAAAGPGA